ncbi:MAG: SemiSWEET transporter [Elsteraceae bacterium]
MTITLLGVDLVQAIGLIAACCTTLAFVPQAVRAVRTRQTKDISLLTFLLLEIGIVLWLAYGVMLGDLPLILSNAITLGLASAILATKLRYG